ncbi:unnamed protein product [Ectocarpus sp. 4 AP-2014]
MTSAGILFPVSISFLLVDPLLANVVSPRLCRCLHCYCAVFVSPFRPVYRVGAPQVIVMVDRHSLCDTVFHVVNFLPSFLDPLFTPALSCIPRKNHTVCNPTDQYLLKRLHVPFSPP